jgi:HD superfamily phosphohydrolase
VKPIRDSVHEYITLGPVATELLDTPTVQRLRHIKQLSTVRLVFPSANHTRFEHSLGVYHLAGELADHLDIDADTAAHLRAAALLHDVGHGPYGHQTERLIHRRTGRDHDEIEWLLTDADRPVCQVLERHGLDPERVAALIDGEGALGAIVSGELDVDRMDYLVRDAHHTGVPYGTIDHGRLIRDLRIEGEEPVLAEGNVATAESLLLARSLMNAIVYRHHVPRIAGAMLERASEEYLDRTDTTVEEFRRLPDHDLLVGLRESVPELGERLEHRQLYKRAVWAGLEDVPTGTVDAGYEEERAAEREIADRADIDPRQVIVDVPSRPTLKESESKVIVNGVSRRLEDASELVGSLRATERARWRLGVYCPATNRETVARAARDVLGVRGRGRTRHGVS